MTLQRARNMLNCCDRPFRLFPYVPVTTLQSSDWLAMRTSLHHLSLTVCVVPINRTDLSYHNTRYVLSLRNSRTSTRIPPDGCLKHWYVACLIYGCWYVCSRASDNCNTLYTPRYVQTKEMRNAELTCYYVVKCKSNSVAVSGSMCSVLLTCAACYWHVQRATDVTCGMRDFRLTAWCWWGLRSSGILHSVEW